MKMLEQMQHFEILTKSLWDIQLYLVLFCAARHDAATLRSPHILSTRSSTQLIGARRDSSRGTDELNPHPRTVLCRDHGFQKVYVCDGTIEIRNDLLVHGSDTVAYNCPLFNSFLSISVIISVMNSPVTFGNNRTF